MRGQPAANDIELNTGARARPGRQVVAYPTKAMAGTVIIDTAQTYLYYVLGNGSAIRYGIGVAGMASDGPASRRSHVRPSGRIGRLSGHGLRASRSAALDVGRRRHSARCRVLYRQHDVPD